MTNTGLPRVLGAALLAFACASSAGTAQRGRSSSAATAVTVAQVETGQRAVTVELEGKRQARTLAIARDPQTGLTTWRHYPTAIPDPERRLVEGQERSSALIITGNRAVIIEVQAPPLRLNVLESVHRFRSMDKAAAAIIPAMEGRTSTPAVRFAEVPLSGQLEYSYLVPIGVSGSNLPWLAGVRAVDDKWMVTLTGRSGKTALVTLDSEYRLLDVRKDQ